ncbi:hypothetical protein ACVWXL_004364 [Bradyrhizobium sp. GM22.5]
MTQIIIDKRFCGPPNSGNGGYVCGRLARHIPGAAEITLRAPPPLDTPLDAVATDDGTWELRDGNKIVATGQPASVELSRLETASFEDACAAELLTPVKPHEHPLPTCFVCGPARAKGDGLRIFAGALRGHNAVLARELDAGSESRRRRRPRRAGIPLVGARLPHRFCLQLRSTERRLRQGTAAAGANVSTDRSPPAPGRTLHHHGLAHRPRRPQTRGRSCASR